MLAPSGNVVNGDYNTPNFLGGTNATVSITPPAGSYVVSSLSGTDTLAYSTFNGYVQYPFLSSTSSLDVQLLGGVTSGTSPISNTFAGGDDNPQTTTNQYLAPTTPAQTMAKRARSLVVHRYTVTPAMLKAP